MYRYVCKITIEVGGVVLHGYAVKTSRKFRRYVYWRWYDFDTYFSFNYFVKIMKQKQLFRLIFQ